MSSVQDRLRTGNSLALVMAMVVAGGLALKVSADMVDHRFDQSYLQTIKPSLLGRWKQCSRVAAQIANIAEVGTAEDFNRMHNNYGEERMGGCIVRWRLSQPSFARSWPLTQMAISILMDSAN